jgi:Uma2 family endonuclease
MDATRPSLHDHDETKGGDRFVVRRDVRWEDYKRALAMRGDHSGPRIAYADGCLEIMSPSREHEAIKSVIGRLVEVFCLERGIDFRTYGSWTLENKRAKKALEPDECFVFGPAKKNDPPKRPDLAIEVVWTSGGISKLQIYRALRVREVWFWRKGVITPGVLRGRSYVEVDRSEVLPGIDLVQLASFIDRDTTSASMRAYRAALTRSAKSARSRRTSRSR